MEFVIVAILFLFVYLFYIFNELTKGNVNIKEEFLEMESGLKKIINFQEKINDEILKDEKFKKIVSDDASINRINEKQEEKIKQKKQIKKQDKEDEIQNKIIDEYNMKIVKINSVSLLIAEKEKMIDLGVSEKTIENINQILLDINMEKQQNQKNREKINKLINTYNNYVIKFPSRYIADILGFSEYYNIK